ncbi:hypothetical protein B0H16DRAFT_1820941 [Mycena metata]|uniref:F-box domain-containing protein n=1 Tax=Mycena metata TaxID=1033252 RepID=A0AAD7NEK1_9AGAR|nr:hypothetical protein B0H16DRAFT_1820941 [Mycena metata]
MCGSGATFVHGNKILGSGEVVAAPEIRSMWENDSKKLKSLQKELTVRRNGLLRERDTIFPAIKLQAFTAAPVRRAPDDILLEIFKALQTMYDHDAMKSAAAAELRVGSNRNPNTPDVRRGPGLLLSRVCSRWRTIACGYSPFWSKFSFHLFQRGTPELVAVYLERSRPALLAVEIDTTSRQGDDPYPRRYYPRGDYAMSLLAAHSDHLFELHVIAYKKTSLPSLRPLHRNLPRLGILDIPVFSTISNEFEVVPRLHTLRLGNAQELTEAAHKFDRTQIRTLILCDANGHQLLPYPNATDLACVETSWVPPPS